MWVPKLFHANSPQTGRWLPLQSLRQCLLQLSHQLCSGTIGNFKIRNPMIMALYVLHGYKKNVNWTVFLSSLHGPKQYTVLWTCLRLEDRDVAHIWTSCWCQWTAVTFTATFWTDTQTPMQPNQMTPSTTLTVHLCGCVAEDQNLPQRPYGKIDNVMSVNWRLLSQKSAVFWLRFCIRSGLEQNNARRRARNLANDHLE